MSFCVLDQDVDESPFLILKVETSCVAKQCLCVVPCVNSKHCDAAPPSIYLFVFRSTWISFSTHEDSTVRVDAFLTLLTRTY